jgi:hypothetical protein
MAITFPFERGRRYPLGALREFESAVRIWRKNDQQFARDLRAPSRSAPSWMRLRLSELIPLFIYTRQVGADDQCTFMIKPEGDPVDAVLNLGGDDIDFQITLAAPRWGKSPGGQANPGYQHHQQMDALNRAEIVSGWPPYTFKDGVAWGEIDCLVGDERDQACLSGLLDALSKKSRHDGRNCTLAVLARDFHLNLLDFSLFESIASQALDSSKISFQSVAIFDGEPGFFVEREYVKT